MISTMINHQLWFTIVNHYQPWEILGYPGIQDEYRNQLLTSLLYAEQLPLCERLEPLEADAMGQVSQPSKW